MAKPPSYRINLRPYRIFYFPFLLPIALLLALFNKISPVPFKIYIHRVDRIGQMAANLEEFMCAIDLGLKPKEFRVFIHRDHPSNSALLELQKRVAPIHNAFLPLFDVCHKLGGLGVICTEVYDMLGDDSEQLITQTEQHLSFTSNEEKAAREQCRAAGIDPDNKFIPVLGRDASYLKHIKEPTDEDSYRNIDINTFIPAMEYLAERFQVVRMGSVVQERLRSNHPSVIDYSTSGNRTELLDIYLPAKCHFFLSCGTGMDTIAAYCFRLPILYVNYLPPQYFPRMKPGSLFIPKKYWHVQEYRYLSLNELQKRGLDRMYTPRELAPHHIIVQDNTPEEITAVCREMVSRLDGSWVDTDEDKELQRRFWAHYSKQPSIKCMGRLGCQFLKENSYWID